MLCRLYLKHVGPNESSMTLNSDKSKDINKQSSARKQCCECSEGVHSKSILYLFFKCSLLKILLQCNVCLCLAVTHVVRRAEA